MPQSKSLSVCSRSILPKPLNMKCSIHAIKCFFLSYKTEITLDNYTCTKPIMKAVLDKKLRKINYNWLLLILGKSKMMYTEWRACNNMHAET